MKARSIKINPCHMRQILLGGAALMLSQTAHALNYYELEVYPYKTANLGETELEFFTGYTRRGTQDQPAPANNAGLTRGSLEITRGVTDKTEVAAYVDYAHASGDNSWGRTATRFHVRTRFAEKGELPVDLGLYAEAEYPRHDVNHDEFELRGIIEKDVNKWTFDINPILEKGLRGGAKAGDTELHYAASAIYRLNERWHPRLDFFGDFGPLRNFDGRNEQIHLISPAVDILFGHGLSASIGVAFGQTRASEQQILRARMEWEFY